MEEDEIHFDIEENNKVSFLWDYFDLDETGCKTAKCKVEGCGRVYTSIYAIKSGNLHIHLKKHVAEYAEMVAKREKWKLEIQHRNGKLTTEKHQRKTEFSNYKCKECNYRGMNQTNLQRHIKKGVHKNIVENERKKAKCFTWDYYGKDSSDPMVAICNACGKRIRMGRLESKKSTGHLRFHLKTKHSESFNSLQLKVFEAKLQRKMKSTKKRNLGRKFKCEMFNCKGRKTLHDKSVHFETIVKNVKCDQCNFKSSSINGLSGHKGKEHPRKKIKIGNKSDEMLSIVKKYVYPCTFCDYKGSTTQTTKKHEERVHLNIRYPCNQCDYKAPSKEELPRHIRSVHDKVKNKCDLCDFQTTSRSMQSHKAAKHMDLIFFCSDCDFSAKTKASIRNHTNRVHFGIRFECDECDYKAAKKSNLLLHIEVKHQGVTYNCLQCSVVFKSKDGLRDHIKIKHSSECKEFKCSHCDYVTKGRLENLKRHIAAIHRKEKFFCETCSFKTTVRYELKKHRCRFLCRKCDFRANMQKEMKLHYKKDHTKEEQKELFQQSIQSNLGPGKYQCDQCSYTTDYGGNLKLHQRKKHAVKPQSNEGEQLSN